MIEVQKSLKNAVVQKNKGNFEPNLAIWSYGGLAISIINNTSCILFCIIAPHLVSTLIEKKML